jgi:hypothetical protein
MPISGRSKKIWAVLALLAMVSFLIACVLYKKYVAPGS